MPENFDKFCYLEFTQPATAESYTVLRSVSIAEGSGEYNKIKEIVHFYSNMHRIRNLQQSYYTPVSNILECLIQNRHRQFFSKLFTLLITNFVIMYFVLVFFCVMKTDKFTFGSILNLKFLWSKGIESLPQIFLIPEDLCNPMSKVCTIKLLRYRDLKIWVCDKNSIVLSK